MVAEYIHKLCRKQYHSFFSILFVQNKMYVHAYDSEETLVPKSDYHTPGALIHFTNPD